MNYEHLDSRIISALNRTQNAIGPDFLQVIVEYENRDYANKDEVIEMVTDADRLTMYGDDKEATDHFYSLPYNGSERQKLLDKAFTYEQYDSAIIILFDA